MPPEVPDPWKMMLDQLSRIENQMLTRSEWQAHQVRFDNSIRDMHKRVDGVQAQAATQLAGLKADAAVTHQELNANIVVVRNLVESIQKQRGQEEREQEKQRSTRLFTVAMSIFAGGVSIITGITVFVVQGVVGG